MVTPALFFDDDSVDRVSYAQALCEGGCLTVQAAPPPQNMNFGTSLSQNYKLYLVDYELTGADGAGGHANYKGGTLATAIREHDENTPIVLLARQGPGDVDRQLRYLESLQIFDDVVFKGAVDQDPQGVIERLLVISNGFTELREGEHTWTGLTALLGSVGKSEKGLLIEAAPPISAQGQWRVPEAARWIQRVLLAHPGILYDPLHAATLLGIEEGSFKLTAVREFFSRAQYAGSFAPPEGRWWRQRLIEAATELRIKYDLPGPINKGFTQAFERESGIRLDPSKCVVSGKYPADSVCYILRTPVMTSYSLVYYPDRRPKVMDEARVSFQAIRESNKIRQELFDPEAQSLIDDILKQGTSE